MANKPRKVIRPYEHLPTDVYRPSQTVKDPALQGPLRVIEDMALSLREQLRRLEIPVMDDDEGVSLDEANEVAQTFPPNTFCQPTRFTNPIATSTGLQNVYAVQARGPYVYLIGDDNSNGHFQVYRINENNTMTRIADLTTTRRFTRMVVSGTYAFGVRVAGGSNRLTIISVIKPNDPQEVAVVSVGAIAKNVVVQGQYAFVACDGPRVKIVDITVPAAPRVIGTAT